MARRRRGADEKRTLSTPEGFVYVFVDTSIQGVVKVGRSEKRYDSRSIEPELGRPALSRYQVCRGGLDSGIT